MPGIIPSRKQFLIVAGIFLASFLYAQKDRVDSLKKVLLYKNDTARVSCMIQIADAYLSYSVSKALSTAMEARAAAVQYGSEVQEANALMEMGRIHARNVDYEEAINVYVKAAEIYRSFSLFEQYVRCQNRLSECYFNKGDFNKALDCSLEAYKAAEEHDYTKGMASALINSGLVYRSMHNYNKSIADYEKALALCQERNDHSLESNIFNNLANAYSDLGQMDKSIEYLNKALEIARANKDMFSESAYLNNLGTTYNEMAAELDTANASAADKAKAGAYYDKALDYLTQSIEIRKKNGDKKGIISTITNIGNIYYNQGRMDEAIARYKQALALTSELEIRETQLFILYDLSEAYKMKEKYDSAFYYSRMYSDLNDSIFQHNLAEKISEMQAKYDVQKAESETRSTQKEKKIITISAFAGGFLLLVIVGILWNRAVVRKRTNIRLNAQKQEIEEKNTELHHANKEIELKNKDITDSITYASRIQGAILPEVEFSTTFRDKGFVLYRPKDIVSGDFYWMAQSGDHILFAAVDCTGHGVPGAFMSIVCSNLLTQAVKEHGLIQPNEILNDVNVRLSETLRQRQDESRVRDGMDIALCCLDTKTNLLMFAGAYNSVSIYRKGDHTELPADKFPVGLFVEEELKKFTHKEKQLEKGDRIYVSSDGYSDQFGGELGKKFKRTSYLDLLSNVQHLPIREHARILEKTHLDWKGSFEQIDDILVIGIEV